MMIEPPNKLRLINGELVCCDGEDVKAYLMQWAQRMNVTADTPINIVCYADLKEETEKAKALQMWGC